MRAAIFHRSTHLNEKQLDPPLDACPFCDSNARNEISVLQDSPSVTLLHCDNCYASSASRMPTEEALNDFYGRYYSTGIESVTFDKPERMSLHIASKALREWGEVRGGQLSIVDFGGGDGTISVGVAEILISHGASSVVIQLVDHCNSVAKSKSEKISVRTCALADIGSRSADIVLASAVLEHLRHPREVMAILFDAMKVDGVFYARTPYVVPLMRLASYFGSKVDFTFPGHLHDMGRKFWDGVGNHFSVKLSTVSSTTSIVESTFDRHFMRTLIAMMMKAPSKILRNHYNLVGGWEVFLKRID